MFIFLWKDEIMNHRSKHLLHYFHREDSFSLGVDCQVGTLWEWGRMKTVGKGPLVFMVPHCFYSFSSHSAFKVWVRMSPPTCSRSYWEVLWVPTYSNSTNDVATGCFLTVKGSFSFKLTSTKPVSSFSLATGNCTKMREFGEERRKMRWWKEGSKTTVCSAHKCK